jgi:hypothetical protein
MDVFAVHTRLVADYDAFTSSLVEVRDQRIKEHLEEQRQRKVRWPDPYLSLNPGFEGGGTIKEPGRARLRRRAARAGPAGAGRPLLPRRASQR